MPKLTNFLRRRRKRQVVSVESPHDLVELAHWIERPSLRLMMPPEMLRMQGGFVYGPNHPFAVALQDGVDALRLFYSNVRPKTICEYYGIKSEGRMGASLPPWEMPWYSRSVRKPPPGEHELAADHGVSFFGPATEEKVALEMRRLVQVDNSVRKKGYRPDLHGDIEGYVMREDDKAVFFVRGGKHRAAVLTHSGARTIPVAFRETFPRVVDVSQANFWPLVRAGVMDVSLAKDILRVYFNGRVDWRTTK